MFDLHEHLEVSIATPEICYSLGVGYGSGRWIKEMIDKIWKIQCTKSAPNDVLLIFFLPYHMRKH
jgi:hypothetical protein